MSSKSSRVSSGGGGGGGGDSISPFIRKTFNMVSDPATVDIVCWDEQGDSFIVLKEFDFASQLLPIYFRHKNFSSFVRQLNFYGFHKRNHEGKFTKFYHPYFKKNQLGLLKQIKRKSTDSSSNVKESVQALAGQVRELKLQYEDLLKIQRQILFMFGSYMRNQPQHAQSSSGAASHLSQPGKKRLLIEAVGGERRKEAGQQSKRHEPTEQATVELLEDAEDGDEAVSEGSERASEFDDDFEDDPPFVVDDEERQRDDDARQAREAAWAELNALQEMLNQFPNRESFAQEEQIKQFGQRKNTNNTNNNNNNNPTSNPNPANNPNANNLHHPANPTGTNKARVVGDSSWRRDSTASNPLDNLPAPLSPLSYPSLPLSSLPGDLAAAQPPKLLYPSDHYEQIKHNDKDSKSKKRKQPPLAAGDYSSSSFPSAWPGDFPYSPQPSAQLSAPPILYAQSSGDPAQLFPSPEPIINPPSSTRGSLADIDEFPPASPIAPVSPSLFFSSRQTSMDPNY